MRVVTSSIARLTLQADTACRSERGLGRRPHRAAYCTAAMCHFRQAWKGQARESRLHGVGSGQAECGPHRVGLAGLAGPVCGFEAPCGQLDLLIVDLKTALGIQKSNSNMNI